MGIQILVDNPEMTYYPGETVRGQVIICQSRPTKTNEVTILLKGQCKVGWKERDSSVDFSQQMAIVPIRGISVPVPSVSTATVDCSAEETYVSSKIVLVSDGETFMILPAGTHTYAFSFDLPNILPSSFTSHVGEVSYILKAEMKRPLLKSNKRVSLPITINGILDLKLEAGAGLPQKCKKVKEPSLVALRTGELSFILNLPERSGFVPGEILDFQAEISNNSNQNIKKVTATLQRVTKFFAKGRIKTVQEAVAEIHGPEVRQKECETWIPANLFVPCVVPTRLGGGCRLIDVQYCLHLEMKMSGLGSSLSGKLPVLIGSNPLDFTGIKDNNYEELPLTPLSEKREESQPGKCAQVGFQPSLQTTPVMTRPPCPPPPAIGFILPDTEPCIPTYVPMSMPMPTCNQPSNQSGTSPPSYAETIAKNRFKWDASDNNPKVKGGEFLHAKLHANALYPS